MTTAKLLFLIDSETPQEMYSFIPRLNGAHPEFRVLFVEPNSTASEYLDAHGVPYDVLTAKQSWTGYLGYVRQLYRFFKMYPFELVHAVGLRAAMVSIVFKIRFNTPLFWHFSETMPVGFSLVVFRVLAAVFCDRMLANSLTLAHQFGRDQRWKGRIKLIYRGYDMKNAPQTVDYVNKNRIAMFLSELPLKAPKTFLRAFQLAVRQNADLYAVIFVEKQKAQGAEVIGLLTELIHQFELKKVIRVEEIDLARDEYALAKALIANEITLFVSPSLPEEPFASDVLQAMASRIPVLATRSGGLTELLSHNQTGFLVPVGDANALAQGMLNVFSNRAHGSMLAQKAFKEFQERFSAEFQLAQLAKVYVEFFPSDEKPKISKAA